MKPQSQESAAGPILLVVLGIAGLTDSQGSPSTQALTPVPVQADEIQQPWLSVVLLRTAATKISSSGYHTEVFLGYKQ